MLHSGLLFESSDGGSRFWLTSEREIIVGRRPPWGDPNVRVASILVARQHARLTAHDGGFSVEDAGSCGGLYLDDELVRGRVPIGPGMRLKLCSEVVYSIRSLTAESLWDVLRDRPMRPDVALRMAAQILSTLLPLHEDGRCHGDLSPHEILCADDGSFVLLLRGWGEAGEDAIRGNPVYTAPETIRHGQIEPATDIYALGLILFEALSGERPYSTDTPLTNMMSKLHGEPKSWPRDWPTAMRQWLIRALMVEPRERPSVRDAIAQLPKPWS